ncbi:MAG TPA: carboxypeptidase-like regulatory domain-containing protein, partial [Vicinamibacterales bacterium]
MFLVFTVALLVGASAYAQGSFFSTLSGTVIDSEGLPIPGANVKVRNNGTGTEINLVSGGDGGFTAPNIPGGNYSVTVELAGFRTT